ncbi:hypothetical protein EGI22_09865, partial [Lacihabitans sp. LS3-19]|uniref:right-handed parallel beta-helix repeat-containing protein n=1 Tax=Lacihabitans sp. LS3-19 TaxID=2487335 RepID=UPI0020CF0217
MLILSLISFFPESIFGQVVYQYVDDVNGIPFSVNANATGSNLLRGAGLLSTGVSCTSANQGFGSTDWYNSTAANISTANANGEFVYLTITPKAGYRLNLTGFKASLRSPNGPTSIRYSYTIGSGSYVENGSSLTPGTSSSCTNSGIERSWTFSSSVITTETVTFKIYGFNSPSSAGEMQLRNIEVAGTIECNPALVASITPSLPSICENDQITLNGLVSGGSIPSYTHLWEIVSGGSGTGSLSSPGTNSSNIFTGLSAGSVNVRYKASYGSAPSCEVISPNEVVTVNGIPTISLTGTLENCIGSTSENIEYSATTHSPDKYSLNFNPSAESEGYSDALNMTLGASPIIVSIPASATPSTYFATLVVENGTTGCQSPVYNLDFIQHALPVVSVSGSNEVCLDSDITLVGNSIPAKVSDSWDTSSPGIASVGIDGFIIGLGVGNTDITYTVTDINGCINTSDIHNVVVNALPVGTLMFTESSGSIADDGEVCSGGEVDFTATLGFDNYNFKLDGSSVQNGSSNTYSTTFTSSGVITVEVTDGNSCSSTFIGANITVGTCNVTNVNTSKNFVTIQAAIDDAGTLAGHTIALAASNFNEQVIVNKELIIKSATATKAIIDFTGTVTGKPTIFDISANNVTVENINFKVDLSKLRSAVVASGAGIDNITVKDNLIEPYGTPAGSYGERNAVSVNYGAYRVATGGVNTVTFSGNTVTAGTYPTMFRSGISVDEVGGTFSGNTLATINHDILVRFGSNGDITIDDNDINGGGIELTEQNVGAGTLSITNNTLDATWANNLAPYSPLIRLKNNYTFRPTTVSGNAFSNHLWGLSLENYNTVTVDNNIFTPLANSTTYRHITVDTKELSSSSSGFYQPNVSATITKNTFNGSGTIGGIALSFANQDNDSPIFGAFVLGTNGSENNFNAGIQSYIKLENITGTVSPNATTAVPWNQNLDAQFNVFDGQTGATASLTENFAIEDKIFHKIDNNVLGFVLVKANNDFVTSNSGSIQQGINVASSGFEVNVGPGTFTENVTVNKFVKIKGSGNTTIVQGVGNTGDLFTYPATSSGTDAMNRASIESMKLTNAQRGIYTNESANFLRIKEVNFDALTSYGLQINNTAGSTDDWLIDNSVFNATTGPGLQIGTAAKVEKLAIQNSTFTNNTSGAIYVGQNSAGTGIFNDVTITGSTFSNNGATNNQAALYIEKLSNATISENTFTDNGISTNPRSIILNLKYDDYSDLEILDNIMNETRAGTMVNGYGLFLAGRNDASYSSNPASVSNVTISGNEISSFQNGIGLENNVDWNSTTVNNNSVANSNTSIYGVGAGTGKTLEVHNNSFINSGTYSVANGVASSTINADCNWFGSTALTAIQSKIVGNVTLDTWLVNGTDDAPATSGFQPVAGSCTGSPIIIASTTPDPITCGETTGGINIVFSGGTAPYDISWSGVASGSATGISSGYDATGLIAGSYTLVVTDANGSTASADDIVLNLPVSNTSASTFFATIQEAIDAASSGNIIEVCDGTYTEDILVNKPITLKSVNGSALTTIAAASANYTINVTADDVTIDGFTISNQDKAFGIYSNNNSGLVVKNNHITNVGGASLVSVNVYGIAVEASANSINDVQITGNTIDDINGGIKGSIGGVAVGFSTGDFDVSNLLIDNNIISNIDASTLAWPDGRGAYGIQINLGSSAGGTGTVIGAMISNNDISDLEGLWATGIGLEGDTPGAIVSHNDISDITDHKGPSNPDASGIKIEDNDGAATVVINNNNFSNIGSGTSNDGFGVNNFTTTIVNANNNYWGATDGPSVVGIGAGVKVTSYVTFCPYLNDVDGVGVSVGCPVKNVDTDKTFVTIQSAIDDAGTDNGDVIEVSSGTYDEQVMVNKELTLNGVGASKPIVNFTGTALGKNSLFDVSSDNVTINNIQFDVDLTKLSSAIVVSGAGIDNIAITNNQINPIGTSAAASTGSYGLRNAISINYAAYRVATGGVNNITVTGNTVTATNDDGFGISRLFRSAVSVDEGGGTYTGNDFTSINQDIMVRFNSNGPILIDNNTFRGGGVQTNSHNAGGGQVDITNNTFDSPFANTYTSSLRLQYNNQDKQTNVTGNTFNNHNWGISLENYKNVHISDNIFTPLTNSTTFRHITVNTKVLASDNLPISQTTIDADISKNTFNGSGISGGTGIAFYNHDNTAASFGTFTIGTSGNENEFNSGISNFIYLGDQVGNSDVIGFPEYAGASAKVTPAVCWSNDLDVKNNKFDVGAGLQLPSAMNLTQRTTLESKLTHKPDLACLGEIQYFLPVHNTTQDTYFANIQPAVDAAVANDVIELAEWTFNERVVIDKSLTLQGTNTDKTLTVIDGSGLGNGDGIQIASGITNVILKNFTLHNFAGVNGNSDAAIYAIGQNNGLTVDNVKISSATLSGGSGIYANGPINGFTVTNSDISDRGNSARGIVIWNGFKENITITGNTLNNNICCGIELQDGTASAVNISNNLINIGSGDNALGINGLRTNTGSNHIEGNTITGGGRFGIEIKNPWDNDNGSNTTTVSNNTVTLSNENTDIRDRAGIAVFRRGVLSSNPDSHPDAPNGVIISLNAIENYKQTNATSSSTGFGIVIEGENHTVTGNLLTNNDVGIQQQAGHTPFTSDNIGDGDQTNIADLYFGRGNSPVLCNNTLSSNSHFGNGVDERIVIGGGLGTIATEVTPTVDDVTDIVVCNGDAISTIVFSGNNIPGVVYNWTNSNAAIGFTTSGSGDIVGYTSSNTTSLAITAIITVTPIVNGCEGTPQDFTITINPTPSVDVVGNQVLCAGETTTAISFSGSGTSYTWVNDNDAIGLALSGTGDIVGFTATNTTGVPQIAYVTVTPNFTGSSLSCAGVSKSFSISVTDNSTAELICQDDVELDNDVSLCTAVYNFDLPKAYDPVFFDGCENVNWQTTNLGWSNYNSQLTRELSGLLISSDGVSHGLIDNTVLPASPDDYTGAFSRLGGYSSTFGNGFRNRVDVYIDLDDPAVSANTYGWDVSSAVSTQSNSHRRDFVFHTSSNATGNVLIGGSNGTNFTRRNDLASINNYEITASGWYTFEWMFVDKGDGTLKADMSVLDNSGTKLWTETRNDPSDIIATQIGGSRYMWFTFIEADNLRIDNVEKANILNTSSDIASGFAFPVGTTTVTVTSEADACGAQAVCTFDVIVKDVDAPLFTNCPTDVVICADDAEYSWTHVTLTDQCSLTGGLEELTYTLTGVTSAGPVTVTSFVGGTMGTETFNEGITTVTYSGKDAAGNLVSNVCSFTVTVNPVAIVDPGTYAPICQGTSVTLGGSFSGAASSATWSDGTTGGTFSPSNTDLNAIYTPPANFSGAVTLTLTSDDPIGPCNEVSSDVELIVNPLPTVYNVAGGGVYCVGTTPPPITLSGTQIGVNYTLKTNSYPFFFGPTISGTGGAISFVSPSNSGEYFIEALNTTTNCSVLMNGTSIIGVGVPPVANVINKIDPLCNGFETGSFNVNVSQGFAPFTYALNEGSFVSSNSFTELGAGLYTITIKDGNGCTSTVNTTIIDPSPIVLVVNDPAAVCSPSTIDLTAPSVTTGSSSGLTFEYFTDTEATILLTSPDAVTTTDTYYIVSSNANGCSDTASVNVIINTPTTSETTESACGSFDWNGTTYTASGTYTFTTTNAAGCDSVATLLLTIKEATTSETTESACGSFDWNGTTYTASGTYTFTTTNAAGCDSVATLLLTIKEATTSETTES